MTGEKRLRISSLSVLLTGKEMGAVQLGRVGSSKVVHDGTEAAPMCEICARIANMCKVKSIPVSSTGVPLARSKIGKECGRQQ